MQCEATTPHHRGSRQHRFWPLGHLAVTFLIVTVGVRGWAGIWSRQRTGTLLRPEAARTATPTRNHQAKCQRKPRCYTAKGGFDHMDSKLPSSPGLSAPAPRAASGKEIPSYPTSSLTVWGPLLLTHQEYGHIHFATMVTNSPFGLC